MKERMQKLLSVKSLVTILLTCVFCYLAVVERLSTEFMGVYTTVIAFYFGTQSTKEIATKTTAKESGET